MWNQHHCLVLLQTENPHQLPSKTKAPWKCVISQPKGVKTQPKGVIFSVVILMVLKTISFRQPASQMGVQFFGGWFFEYYVSFFLYVLIRIIIICQSKEQEVQLGSGVPRKHHQKNVKRFFFVWNAFFFWDANFFWLFKKRQFVLLPVDLGIYTYILW